MPQAWLQGSYCLFGSASNAATRWLGSKARRRAASILLTSIGQCQSIGRAKSLLGTFINASRSAIITTMDPIQVAELGVKPEEVEIFCRGDKYSGHWVAAVPCPERGYRILTSSPSLFKMCEWRLRLKLVSQ